MGLVKSLDELKAIRDNAKNKMDLRTSGDKDESIKIIIGMATCGIAAGARKTFFAMFDEAKALELANINFIQSGCMGFCYAEPTVEIRIPGQEPILYGNVTPEKGIEIIREHIQKGMLVQNLIIGKPFETI